MSSIIYLEKVGLGSLIMSASYICWYFLPLQPVFDSCKIGMCILHLSIPESIEVLWHHSTFAKYFVQYSFLIYVLPGLFIIDKVFRTILQHFKLGMQLKTTDEHNTSNVLEIKISETFRLTCMKALCTFFFIKDGKFQAILELFNCFSFTLKSRLEKDSQFEF